jgi:hypothetical protein
MTFVTHGEERTYVWMREVPMGEDVILMLGGGTEHVGAVALAVHTGDGISVETVSAPGHKEGTIVRALANRAAERLRKNVMVVCGIHIDDAKRDEIAEIEKNCHVVLDKYLGVRANG